MKANEEMREDLARFRSRIRLYDGWNLLQRGLPFALLAAIAVLAAGRLLPLDNLLLWASLPPAAWLAGVLGFSLLRPLADMAAARRVDRQAALKERLSSSLFFAGWEGETPPDPFREGLIEELHADARQAARAVDIKRAFPLEFQHLPLLAAAGLALACVLLAALPNPMTQVIADRRAVAAETRRQAEEIENLRAEIEKSSDLSPADKEELLRQLEELAAQLRENPGDLEQALADLSRVEETLRPKLDPAVFNSQLAMQALSRRLQELAGRQPQADNRDLTAAVAALSELAENAGSNSQSEREELSAGLAGLASQASQAGQFELAQALAAMAEAVRRGDQFTAGEKASAAQKALANASREQARQSALNKTLAKLQDSRQAVAGSCKNPGSGAMAAGQNPGAGQSQGQTTGGGGGSQANTLPPFTGGAMNLHGPAGSKPVNPADMLGGNIYVPRTQAGGSNGAELQIGGQDSGQGQETVTESQNPLPGTSNPALTPYRQVYREYLDAANQAMEQSYIPGYLKEYVKSYFSQLEP